MNAGTPYAFDRNYFMLEESELGPYMSYAICVVCDNQKAYYSSIRETITCTLCGAVSTKDGAVKKILASLDDFDKDADDEKGTPYWPM